MRRQSMNFRMIFRIISLLLIQVGLAMLTALAFSLYYHPEGIHDFQLFKGTSEFYPILTAGLLTALVGALGAFVNRNAPKTTTRKEAYLVVTFSWIAISFFGSLPFYFSGYFNSFTDSFFETISGFTTTGASILTDIEVMPHGLLYWRSLTHWLGGMGVIVLSLAILPLLGIGGMQLFSAEAPGPTADKIHPKVKEMAKRLWGIYTLVTIVLIGLLMLGEMNFFDAICHAYATMGTGGFSTKNASIINFSAYTQYVIIFFMMVAGTNFNLVYFGLKRKFSKIRSNEEFLFYIAIIAISTLFITAVLWFQEGMAIEKTFRDSLFQVVSIITTTGFVSSDYLLWPSQLWVVLFLLFFVGGSAGSTGGGVKVIRILLLIKNSLLEFRRLIHPQAIIPVRLNGKPVASNTIFLVFSFFLFYISTFVFGVVLLMLVNMDFVSAIGASASALGNIGPGLGSVGPVFNYAHIPAFGKWVLSALMLLGRLELFTVLIIFSPTFWRK